MYQDKGQLAQWRGQGRRRRAPVVDGLGGVFEDAMKALVPGWDQRPEWMKQIKIKLSPQRMLEQARLISPSAAAKVEGLLRTQAQQVGGQYVWAKAEEAAMNPLVWVGGGALVLLLVGQMMGRRR